MLKRSNILTYFLVEACNSVQDVSIGLSGAKELSSVGASYVNLEDFQTQAFCLDYCDFHGVLLGVACLTNYLSVNPG